MAATLSEVKQVIEEAFPGANVDGVQEEHYRVLGSIVWKDFKGMPSEDRHRLVTEKVRNRLGLKGINIGILFPLAPGEKL
jgi:stress-induced morphogen